MKVADGGSEGDGKMLRQTSETGSKGGGGETAAWVGVRGWKKENFRAVRMAENFPFSTSLRSLVPHQQHQHTPGALHRNRKSAEWKKEIKPSQGDVGVRGADEKKSESEFFSLFKTGAALRHTWWSPFFGDDAILELSAVPSLGPSQKLELKSDKSN